MQVVHMLVLFLLHILTQLAIVCADKESTQLVEIATTLTTGTVVDIDMNMTMVMAKSIITLTLQIP